MIKKTIILFLLPLFNGALSAFERPAPVIEEVIDRSVRIKVTNDCQFSCRFCHNEGTESPTSGARARASVFLDSAFRSLPPVENITIPDIEDTAVCTGCDFWGQLEMYKRLGYNEIHLTGGEPTCYSRLPQLVKLLVENGFTVKMTSNGQIAERMLMSLVQAGLAGINFSILTLDPEEFLATQLREYPSKEVAVSVATGIIEKACRNVQRARELGLPVKINTVIAGPHDTCRLDSLLAFAEKYGVTVNVLPVISADQTPEDKKILEECAFSYALSKGARYVKTVCPRNSSNGSHRFVLPSGVPLVVKFIRHYQPEQLCASCKHFGKASCTENFYGLRVEYRGGKPFARLCVQRSDSDALMPLDRFVGSPLSVLAPSGVTS